MKSFQYSPLPHSPYPPLSPSPTPPNPPSPLPYSSYMNSLYQLALGTKATPKTSTNSPATLLSLVRSVIDLLVEQPIGATLWVKLPPGDLWHSEIQRYHLTGVPHTIYDCQSELKHNQITPTPEHSIIPVKVTNRNWWRREYFLLVLSPEFCGLILAHRPLPKNLEALHTISSSCTLKAKRNQQLQVMSSFEGQVIQRVLDGIKTAIVDDKILTMSSDLKTLNFICPRITPEPELLSQLLARQLHRQDEVYRQTTAERNARMQQQNQDLVNTLQLKDEYLSNLCQELRTPLTHMKTALSLLNSPQIKPNQRQKYLQIINTECDRQNSLITGLLELVNLDRSNTTVLETVSLSEIIPGVVSTYQPLAQEKGIMLAYTVPTDLPTVICISSWLRQIAINLLHNSIKFTNYGGEVWVRGRIQGDYVQLEFRDTGLGIAESDIPKIFDRFYRVRPMIGDEVGGAGMGLTIVQQLLLRCGGSISVKSKVGEGSTFKVLLAIAPLIT